MFKKVNTPVLGVVENMSGYIINGEAKQPLHPSLSMIKC